MRRSQLISSPNGPKYVCYQYSNDNIMSAHLPPPLIEFEPVSALTKISVCFLFSEGMDANCICIQKLGSLRCRRGRPRGSKETLPRGCFHRRYAIRMLCRVQNVENSWCDRATSYTNVTSRKRRDPVRRKIVQMGPIQDGRVPTTRIKP
jgi:hypothetical protein